MLDKLSYARSLLITAPLIFLYTGIWDRSPWSVRCLILGAGSSTRALESGRA